MTPDQVEDASWTPEDWSSFNELALATVERQTNLRKLIPAGPTVPNAYLVEVVDAGPSGAGLGFGVERAWNVTRIRVPFLVCAEQLHDTTNIRALIERVARRLAFWEDQVLAYGDTAAPATTNQPSPRVHRMDAPDGVSIDVDPSTTGLLTPTPIRKKSRNIFKRVKLGVRELRASSHGGDLNAIFTFDDYMDVVQAPSSSRTGLDRIRDALGSKEAGVCAVPPDPSARRRRRLAVFTPDPGALDLAWANRARLSYVGTDADGNMKLRLEESFLLRIKDPTALAVVARSAAKGSP